MATNNFTNPAMIARSEERMRSGVIMQYDSYKNTATVVLTAQDTSQIDEIVKDVPCPTFPGLQLVSPFPGQMCIVQFLNGTINNPVITSFFSPSYLQFDHSRQSYAGYTVPYYLIGM